MNTFKQTISLKERQEKSTKLLNTYFPDKIPVIIQKYKNNENLPDIKHIKFLVPNYMTHNQLLLIIRNKMKITLDPSIALYLISENGKMVTGSVTIGDIYEEFKNKEDNFLYFFYCGENTFG